MRKLVMLSVILCSVLIGWCWRPAPAATSMVDSAALYQRNLHAGDKVRLYLQHSPSTADYVEGTLTAFDGSSFEVSGETEEFSAKGNVTGVAFRKTLTIVPVSGVSYVQKTISEQFVPSNQP